MICGLVGPAAREQRALAKLEAWARRGQARGDSWVVSTAAMKVRELIPGHVGLPTGEEPVTAAEAARLLTGAFQRRQVAPHEHERATLRAAFLRDQGVTP